ncbi:hypothetical protein ABTX35_16445 [Streptomyces sp. NPDC096080]|uniref:hypothetical protein n=1 Tax=Streptomyces sp. NPDC096080 TaxID=3156693 RepID=UPI003331438C
MSRDLGPRRPRRLDRRVLVAASVTALSLTASGCVVVHGEREVLPATTRVEAAVALREFTAAYNKADAAYDSSLDADHVTGAFGDIDAARLKAGRVNNPGGNSAHRDLEFSDAVYTIPQKAGWPRWFMVEAQGNRGGDRHWLLVFTRDGAAGTWRAAYLTLVAPGALPEIRKNADGWAETVPANSTELAVAPDDLSTRYAAYLKDGGAGFTANAHTSGWRAQRAKAAKRPGLATQYIDEPVTGGGHAPLALRTVDGGALVFFTHRRYEKQTAFAGTSIPEPNPNVKALTEGEVRQSLTMEFMSNGVAVDPARGAAGGTDVTVVSRLEGLISAQGG